MAVKCSSSVWSHSVHFRVLGDIISRKPVVAEKMDQNVTFKVRSLVPAEYLLLLSVQCQFGSFGAFPVFDDLVSTFHLNIEGSLYC